MQSKTSKLDQSPIKAGSFSPAGGKVANEKTAAWSTKMVNQGELGADMMPSYEGGKMHRGTPVSLKNVDDFKA